MAYPYQVVASYADGREAIISEGVDPNLVRIGAALVSRNPALVKRIVLKNTLTHRFVILWSADWIARK